MKKMFKLLPLLLIAVLGLTFQSCDDDKDEAIQSSQLPSNAKEFINQYFPSLQIVSSQKDKNDYEVILSDGTSIDFNKKGEWTDVDAALGKSLPTGFYPAAIDSYIAQNFQGLGINEISKDKRGYEVELVTGTEMMFSYDGTFIGIGVDR